MAKIKATTVVRMSGDDPADAVVSVSTYADYDSASRDFGAMVRKLNRHITKEEVDLAESEGYFEFNGTRIYLLISTTA